MSPYSLILESVFRIWNPSSLFRFSTIKIIKIELLPRELFSIVMTSTALFQTNVDYFYEEQQEMKLSFKWRSDLRWDMDDQLDKTLKFRHLKALAGLSSTFEFFKTCKWCHLCHQRSSYLSSVLLQFPFFGGVHRFENISDPHIRNVVSFRFLSESVSKIFWFPK